MLEFITNLLTVGASLGLILSLLARFVPNDKLYGWGVKSGQFLNSFGSAKMGSSAWEKLEDFLVNSIGEYLKGVKIGLDEDEE
jgi:hypothetical protein